MAPTRRIASLTLALAAAALSAACAGGLVRADVPAGPLHRGAPGELRGAMTCDGDWLGGSSSSGGLAADLDLASRRGVEVVIDMRSARVRALGAPGGASGRGGARGDRGRSARGDRCFGAAALRRPSGSPTRPSIGSAPCSGRTTGPRAAARRRRPTRHLRLRDPPRGGRRRRRGDGPRAARSIGLTESCEAFVTEQVARILEGR